VRGASPAHPVDEARKVVLDGGKGVVDPDLLQVRGVQAQVPGVGREAVRGQPPLRTQVIQVAITMPW
jgi:hypothetical protein